MHKGFTAIHFESLFTLDCNNKGTSGHLDKLSRKDFRFGAAMIFWGWKG